MKDPLEFIDLSLFLILYMIRRDLQERSPAARALAKDLRDAQFPPVRLFEIFDSSATKT
jgi:hypothetical protein